MEDESRVAGSNGLSYWLDVCEDIPYDLINDFVDFDIPIVQQPFDSASNQDFFGGIDHLLDSIKNGGGLPPVVSKNNSSVVNGNGVDDSIVRDGRSPNEPLGASKDLAENSGPPPNGLEKNNLESKGQENYDIRDDKRSRELRDTCLDSEERCCKRVRANGCKSDRQYPSRGQYYSKDRERRYAGKRVRESDENDRRHREHVKRREHCNGSSRRNGRDRDWRDREPRGYWERDWSGSNEMVFRLGTWEAARHKVAKAANDKVRECNGKMEKEVEQPKEKLLEEQARQYQLDVLEQAKMKNTIAFLETGAGKTLIAVLLIKSICHDLQKQNRKMLSVFLVPKVPLVYQQSEVIRERTGYQVGHYCGEMGQDFWDARRWQCEFETKQVLVMTQILLNILRHSIIKMEVIDLLILNECHHAVKKHPFSLVMSEFYHTTAKEKRSSVFGMTASPVNLKGVSRQVDCAIKIRNLESKLDAVVYTVKDRKELEKHVPMPSEVVVEYDKAASLWSLHEEIKQMEVAVEEAALLSSRRSKWQFIGGRDAGAKQEFYQVYGVSERTGSDGAANLIQKLRAINYALGELGQWCAYKLYKMMRGQTTSLMSSFKNCT